MLQFKVFIYHVFTQELTCYFIGFYYFFRDATGMVLHRDSKWYQQWQEFKDNNPVVTGKVMTFTTLLCNDHDQQKLMQFCKKNFCCLFTSHIKR